MKCVFPVAVVFVWWKRKKRNWVVVISCEIYHGWTEKTQKLENPWKNWLYRLYEKIVEISKVKGKTRQTNKDLAEYRYIAETFETFSSFCSNLEFVSAVFLEGVSAEMDPRALAPSCWLPCRPLETAVTTHCCHSPCTRCVFLCEALREKREEQYYFPSPVPLFSPTKWLHVVRVHGGSPLDLILMSVLCFVKCHPLELCFITSFLKRAPSDLADLLWERPDNPQRWNLSSVSEHLVLQAFCFYALLSFLLLLSLALIAG